MGATALAKWAIGSEFQVEDEPDNGSFTAVAQVRDISGFGIKTDTTDTTPHSAEEGFEEVVPTIHRNNELTIELNFLKTESQHTRFISDQRSRQARNYRVVLANSMGQWDFCAYVVGTDQPLPVDDAIRMSVTFKPTGIQSFT